MLRWWRTTEGYCTICAIAVLIGFAALGFYVEPRLSSGNAQFPHEKARTDTNKEAPDDSVAKQFWWWLSRDPTGFFTLVLSVFTGLLVVVTWKQVGLSSAEFVATHRPRIRVRYLAIDRLCDGEPIVIHFQLSNVGGTKAKIVRNEISLMMRSGSTDQYAAGSAIPKLGIDGGGHCIFRIELQPPYKAEWDMASDGGGKFRCDGIVEYVDSARIKRETRFQRQGVKGGGFRQMDTPNPDYEHED